MNEQIPMTLSGTALRDIGIAQAVDHAEAEAPGWSVRALEMLRRYITEVGGEFMGENFRVWATARGLEEPPSKRAFGSIIVKAKNRGMIRFVGHRSVDNPKAHKAFASVWVKQ